MFYAAFICWSPYLGIGFGGGGGSPKGLVHNLLMPWGAILVGTLSQRRAGGSTDPEIVARNNVLCRRRRLFFLGIRQGELFCSTLCVRTQNTQNFVEKSKMAEKHKKG